MPEHPATPTRSLGLLIGLYIVLSAYLFTEVPLDGDGAAYALQAMGEQPFDRSIHAGYLVPLWLWTHAGLPPAALSVLWGAAALVLATAVGARLLSDHPRDRRLPPASTVVRYAPLLAPASILAMEATWRATGTVEIHGPLATTLLGVVVAWRSDRPYLGALLLAWAATIQPAAWALAPGLAVAFGPARRATLLRTLGAAAVLHTVVLVTLWPDWWSGGRGLLGTAPVDRSAWQTAQAGWRFVAQDLGPAALPMLAGLLLAARHRAAGLILAGLGVVLITGRHSDNASWLPLAWLACCFAPLSVRWLDDLASPRRARLATAATGILLALGLAEATSRHDADVRRAERGAVELVAAGCDRGDLDWATARRLELLCGHD